MKCIKALLFTFIACTTMQATEFFGDSFDLAEFFVSVDQMNLPDEVKEHVAEVICKDFNSIKEVLDSLVEPEDIHEICDLQETEDRAWIDWFWNEPKGFLIGSSSILIILYIIIMYPK